MFKYIYLRYKYHINNNNIYYLLFIYKQQDCYNNNNYLRGYNRIVYYNSVHFDDIYKRTRKKNIRFQS